MKNKFVIFIILIHSVFLVHAQEAKKGEYWNVLKKLSNANADFFISNPVRFKDSTGKVVSVKNIVILENSYMIKVAKKYGKKLLPYLVSMLNDSTRDWAANLLLYSITGADAVVLKFYSVSKVDEWRNYRKQKDIETWKSYIK